MMQHKYKIGLALSGGGVKGFAHAGALKAIEEFGLKPEIISGTSAGSVVAALYSAGYTPEDISKMFKSKGFNSFAGLTFPTEGFFEAHKFILFIKRKLKRKKMVNIEDLPIPIKIVSTDIDNGKKVIFESGSIAERVIASASVPIVLVPTEIDGVHYVDGGVFCNFPVRDIADECETVIGINVSPLVPTNYKRNILGIAERSYNFMFRANTIADCKRCDILVEVADALKYGTWDLDNVEDIFRLGYETAKLELSKFYKQIENNDNI